MPMQEEVGAPKSNRTVGIFYFNWHAAVRNPAVHDIAKIVAANPTAPAWGPVLLILYAPAGPFRVRV